MRKGLGRGRKGGEEKREIGNEEMNGERKDGVRNGGETGRDASSKGKGVERE